MQDLELIPTGVIGSGYEEKPMMVSISEAFEVRMFWGMTELLQVAPEESFSSVWLDEFGPCTQASFHWTYWT